MKDKRFVSHDNTVEEYVESLENKTTIEKTKRDVKWMEMFLRNEKGDEREVQNVERLIPFCKDLEIIYYILCLLQWQKFKVMT